MDMLLIVVTLVSLLAALAMAFVTWRTTQETKQRAEARVAALAAAAGVERAADAPGLPVAPVSPGIPTHTVTDSLVAPLTPAAAATAVSRPQPTAAVADEVAVSSGFLASEPAREDGPSPQRMLAAAAAVLGVALTVFAWVRLPDAPAVAAAPPALELLSLRHEREGANLSVAGLVRNGPTAPAAERVSAVVLLFDRDGAFVTSAQAPLGDSKLVAGATSPFEIKVAAPQAVARYRVSFRTADGPLSHVDRRRDPAEAAAATLAR